MRSSTMETGSAASTASGPRALVALFKPGITTSAMITAAWGIFAASTHASPLRAAGIVAGVGLLVASAGALNMAYEADTDRLMPRTCDRPVASGRLSRQHAGIAAAVAGVAGTVLLAWLGTLAGVVLGLLSLVVYAGVYTPMKRVSPLALLVGALPGAAPPLIAAAALGPRALPAGLGLFLLLFLWQIPHFGGIVVRRADEYRAAGLRIAPPRQQFGEAVRGVRIVAAALVIAPALVAPWLHWSPLVVVGLGVAALPQAIAAFGPAAAAEVWGKRVFLGSLPYLPLVGVTIAVDALVAAWLG